MGDNRVTQDYVHRPGLASSCVNGSGLSWLNFPTFGPGTAEPATSFTLPASNSEFFRNEGLMALELNSKELR